MKATNEIHQFFWDLVEKTKKEINYESGEEPKSYIEEFFRRRHALGRCDEEYR